MTNFSEACPDGVLKLGYKIEFFPYFYWSEIGKFKGSLVNFWRAVSKMLGCTSHEFVRYNFSQICDEYSCTKLFGGAIDRGEIFAPVDAGYLHAEDAFESRYSTTVLWEKSSPDLNFYLVFKPYLLLIILVLYLVTDAIVARINILKRINGSRHRLVPYYVEFIAGFIDIVAHCFIFNAFVALMYIHNCYFKGNSVIVTARPPTLFTDMLAQFAQGRRKVVIESGNMQFVSTDLISMFGSERNVFYGDTTDERLEMVCNDRSMIGFFYDGDLIYYLSNDSFAERCPLSMIYLSADQPSPVQWVKDSILLGDPYNFVYNRNISSKIVKKINFLLESVYTWDNMQGVILRRTIPMEYLDKTDKFREAHKPFFSAEETAMTMEAMLIPLEFFFIGLAFSFIIFVIECMPFTMLRRRVFGIMR